MKKLLLLSVILIGCEVFCQDVITTSEPITYNQDGTFNLPPSPGIRNVYWLQGGQWTGNLYDIKCPVRVNTFEDEEILSISVHKVFCKDSEFSDLEKALRHFGYGINGWGSTDGEFNSFHVYLEEKSLFELLKDINRFFNPKNRK